MAAEATRDRPFVRLVDGRVPVLRWLDRLRGDRVLPGVALIAAVVLVLIETPLVAAPHLPLPIAFAIVIVHVGAVPMALRIPNIAAPLSLAAALTLQWLAADTGSMLWPWSPVLITTQCLVLGAVASRRTLPVALLHWVLAVVLSACLAAVRRPTSGDETSVDIAVFGSITAALILVALLGTQWRRVRSELVHERQVAEEEAERRLIAEEAGAEFDRIAAQSRQALDEMRGLLRVLRESETDAERRPQPGLHDVAELVGQARDAGMTVTLLEPDGPWTAGVGQLTGLTAYRIVQEATSNALRHAPGSTVHIVLARVADDIEVTVTNEGSTEPDRSASRPGHGLIGMTERAASVGGTVRFGPTESGGFRVQARLPVFPKPEPLR